MREGGVSQRESKEEGKKEGGEGKEKG